MQSKCAKRYRASETACQEETDLNTTPTAKAFTARNFCLEQSRSPEGTISVPARATIRGSERGQLKHAEIGTRLSNI